MTWMIPIVAFLILQYLVLIALFFQDIDADVSEKFLKTKRDLYLLLIPFFPIFEAMAVIFICAKFVIRDVVKSFNQLPNK